MFSPTYNCIKVPSRERNFEEFEFFLIIVIKRVSQNGRGKFPLLRLLAHNKSKIATIFGSNFYSRSLFYLVVVLGQILLFYGEHVAKWQTKESLLVECDWLCRFENQFVVCAVQRALNTRR